MRPRKESAVRRRVGPTGKSALCMSLLCSPASSCAASWIAGLSRKLPACSCDVNSERTSRSSSVSPPQACCKNSPRSAGGCSSADWSRRSTCFHRSASIGGPSAHFPIEPSLRRAPVAHHGNRRYFEHLGGFFHAQPAEEAQLDHLHFAGIEPPQRVHRVIERCQVCGPLATHRGSLVQRNVLHSASAL